MRKAVTSKHLRVALIYNGHVVHDRTLGKSSQLTLGAEDQSDFLVPVIGIDEGFELFSHTDEGYRVRLSDRLEGSFHIGGQNYRLDELLSSEKSERHSTAMVCTRDAQQEAAKTFEVALDSSDWGIIQFGEMELIFQFVVPRSAVLSASTLGGGKAAQGLRGLVSVLGFGLLISLCVQLGVLYYASLNYDPIEEFEAHKRATDVSVKYQSAQKEIEDRKKKIEQEKELEDVPELLAAVDLPEAETLEIKKFTARSSTSDQDTDFDDIGDSSSDVSSTTKSLREALGPKGTAELFNNSNLISQSLKGFEYSPDGGGSGFTGGVDGDGIGGGLAGAGNGNGCVGDCGDIGGIRGGGGPSGRVPRRPRTGKPTGKPKPTIKIDKKPTAGKFCKAGDIQKVVKKRASRLRNCYERRLLATPSLNGKIVMQWKIMVDGSASSAKAKSSTLKDPAVARCLQRVISRMKFVKPDRGICVVEYPFAFFSR